LLLFGIVGTCERVAGASFNTSVREAMCEAMQRP
jgi:hypothetical protein